MKNILLALVCGACLFASSTAIVKEDIPLDSSMSFVFESDVPVNQKMLNAKTWIAKTFGDYKSVLQYEDNENHRIIIKGSTVVSTKVSGDAVGEYKAFFTSTYDFKEDKFRIKYEDIQILYTVSYHGSDLDLPTPLEDFFSTARNDRYLVELKDELEVLKEKSQGKLTRKERENLDAKITKLKADIVEQEAYVTGKGKQEAEKRCSDFQKTFWGLLTTAANEIETVDDF